MRILLTEWEKDYRERAATVISHISNTHNLHKLLITILTKKVWEFGGVECHMTPKLDHTHFSAEFVYVI